MAGGASNGFVGLYRFEKLTKNALNRTRTGLVPGNSSYGFDLSSTKGNIIIKWSEKNIDIGKKYISTLRIADDTGRIAFMRQEPSLRDC